MSDTRTYPQFLVVLRGPAGVGKTTLAKSVQAAADQRIATIDTDLFNWEIVPGEPDKALVYRNLVMLAESYLRSRYSVIISGLILSSEEAGAMQKLRRFAASRGVIFLDFYCWASREVVVQRNRTRDKPVPEAAVLRWWEQAELDKPNVGLGAYLTLDMNAWRLRCSPIKCSLPLSRRIVGCLPVEQRRLRANCGKTVSALYSRRDENLSA